MLVMPFDTSTHLTVCKRPSQSGTWSAGHWKAILDTLHLRSCSLRVMGRLDFKARVMFLVHLAWRWPTWREEYSNV